MRFWHLGMRFWHCLERRLKTTYAFVASVCQISTAFSALTELQQQVGLKAIVYSPRFHVIGIGFCVSQSWDFVFHYHGIW